MYMKTKELGWNETQGIQSIGIEHSQGNRIVDQRQELKIWENYITELYDRTNRPETLEAEPIKEMRNRKATGDDDIPKDVLKLLGEGGLKKMTKLSNTIHNTGEWPQDFTEVTMIALTLCRP